jgi:hypothetical protein
MLTLLLPFQVPGRWVWVAIWVGLLLLGSLGLIGALQWGRETNWRNLDEVLRGAGTVLVSAGMIMFLQGISPIGGLVLMFLSLVCFVGAFMAGKKLDDHTRPPE